MNLAGWQLRDGGDISVSLNGIISPFGFYLLERTDDSSVASVQADQIYTGALSNSGETLELRAAGGRLIDSANAAGGGWPAGDASDRKSMERIGGEDQPANWAIFNGPAFARDAAGGWIQGSPRQVNSPFLPTPTASATPVLTPTTTTTPWPRGSVLINEVAWAGTRASASHEWIELHNTLDHEIDLSGWRLTDGGDVSIALTSRIPPHGYLLLERTSDRTVADIPADTIYRGSLRNSGERLQLLDSSGALVDSANGNGGRWPAGSSERKASMERWGGDDRRGNWGTFTGYFGVGVDAEGGSIQGTPRQRNSLHFPTPTPTWVPGRLVINEVLIRPHYDWEGSGGVTTADEFIEIYNHGPGSVLLRGWILDDISDSGSKPFPLPGVRVEPQGYAVFFRSKTHIALNDGGDSVRLLTPSGKLVDEIHYLRVRAYNLSYGRLPDGSSTLAYGLWPTPGKENLLFEETDREKRPYHPSYACGLGEIIGARPARLGRTPSARRLLQSLGLGICLTD